MKFSSLPFLNIMGKKGRNGALFAFAVLLSFSLFGGSLLLLSLRRGLDSLEQRLGADIIVVPYEARTKVSADTILNQGNRTYFYMSDAAMNRVKEIEGVEKVSPQIYFCSMNAGCCSVSLQLIGFDPLTDFTIQPWVRETFRGTLQTGDILIGSKVTLSTSRKLKFFDHLWNVAAQLEETGTGFYFNSKQYLLKYVDKYIYFLTDSISNLTGLIKFSGFNIRSTCSLVKTFFSKIKS